MISQGWKLGPTSYLVCWCTIFIARSLLLWWRTKVIWGKQWSNCENIANAISQERKLGRISYLVCWCTVPYSLQEAYCFWWRSKVIWGQPWLNCENIVNTSRREAWTDLIFIYYVGVPYSLQEAYCFGGGQISFGVNIHESICEDLVNRISQEGKLGQITYLVYRCTIFSARSLVFLVVVTGHVWSTRVNL